MLAGKLTFLQVAAVVSSPRALQQSTYPPTELLDGHQQKNETAARVNVQLEGGRGREGEGGGETAGRRPAKRLRTQQTRVEFIKRAKQRMNKQARKKLKNLLKVVFF